MVERSQAKENWLRQPHIKSSVESEKEIKISKEHKSIVFRTVEIQDKEKEEKDKLLKAH